MKIWRWIFLNKLRTKVIYIQNMTICEWKTGKKFLRQRSQITQKEHLVHRHGAADTGAVSPLFMRNVRQDAKNWCKSALIWNIHQVGLKAIAQVKDMANINRSLCNNAQAFALTNWSSISIHQETTVVRARFDKLPGEYHISNFLTVETDVLVHLSISHKAPIMITRRPFIAA